MHNARKDYGKNVSFYVTRKFTNDEFYVYPGANSIEIKEKLQ